jgi:hypothetical protein
MFCIDLLKNSFRLFILKMSIYLFIQLSLALLVNVTSSSRKCFCLAEQEARMSLYHFASPADLQADFYNPNPRPKKRPKSAYLKNVRKISDFSGARHLQFR